MKRWIACLITGFVTALLLLLSAQWAQAGALEQTLPPTETLPDCRECHWDIYVTWEGSAHGKGLSCGQCHLADQQDNHARFGHGAQGGSQQCMSCHTTGYDPNTDTWQEDNVHCTACHTPIPADHPKEPAPTNRSVELCGRCHIQARFEWENSRHGQAGVVCVSCHNQHKTSLKSEKTDVSEQCIACHESRTAGFTSSIHAKNGLSCGDCHLSNLTGPIGEGSAKRNHTFEVELTTCMACHRDRMHQDANPSNNAMDSLSMSNGSLDSMSSAVTTPVSATPPPFNPLGFVVIVGVGGISFGMLLPVLISKQIQQLTKKH